MTRAPTPAAIHDVEARVAQSRRDIGERVRRATVAMRANLARPSMMAVVAGAAGLIAFWMARRHSPRAPSSAGVAGTTSVAGLVGAFVLHYITQQLPFVVRQVRAALEQSSPPPDPGRSESPGAEHPAPRTLH